MLNDGNVRKVRKKEEEEKILQTKGASGSTPEATTELESRISAVRGDQPLPESVRAFFELRLVTTSSAPTPALSPGHSPTAPEHVQRFHQRAIQGSAGFNERKCIKASAQAG